MATIEEQLNTLKEQYREDQDQIVKARKDGFFDNQYEDILAQSIIWENFIVSRHKITSKDKDAKEIVDYFFGSVCSDHIETRKGYQDDEYDRYEYVARYIRDAEIFEDRMIELGLFTEIMPLEEKGTYWDECFTVEKEIMPEKGEISKVDFARLCVAQTPFINAYFERIKEINDVSF